jgi:hypothetical protein
MSWFVLLGLAAASEPSRWIVPAALVLVASPDDVAAAYEARQDLLRISNERDLAVSALRAMDALGVNLEYLSGGHPGLRMSRCLVLSVCRQNPLAKECV